MEEEHAGNLQRSNVGARGRVRGRGPDRAAAFCGFYVSGAETKLTPAEVFARVDALAAPRLVEYWEQDPCTPPYTNEIYPLCRVGLIAELDLVTGQARTGDRGLEVTGRV